MIFIVIFDSLDDFSKFISIFQYNYWSILFLHLITLKAIILWFYFSYKVSNKFENDKARSVTPRARSWAQIAVLNHVRIERVI